MEYIFEAEVAIKAAQAGSPDDPSRPWIVEGQVASDALDYDKELLEQAGVWKGLDTFDTMGRQVDYEHMFRQTKDPRYIIGVGRDRALRNGIPILSAELFNSPAKPLAKSVWEHVNTRDSAGNYGYAGFSVEGRVLSRDPKNRNVVKGLEIFRVTISMTPKGLGRTRIVPMDSVVKALCGDAADLKDFEAQDGGFEWMKAVLDAEGQEMPPFRSVAALLKSYTTGQAIVMPGALPDVSAMRQQAIVSPPAARAKRKLPQNASSGVSARKAVGPVASAREQRRMAWRAHVVARGYPASVGDEIATRLERQL